MSRIVEYRVTPSDATDTADDLSNAWARWPETFDDDGSIALDGLDLGVSYDIRVRSHDSETGDFSTWVTSRGNVVEKDAGVPPALDSLRLTKGDCVTFELPMEVIDLRGYLIRHAPNTHEGGERGWGIAETAHEGIVANPPFLLCRVPKGYRTILARPIDWDDNEGPPITLPTYRGPIDDQGDVLIDFDDHALDGFSRGNLVGGTPGPPLLADGVTGEIGRASCRERV